jgi:hypothetical protein
MNQNDDKQVKLLLGKVLGEIYRLQNHSNAASCPASQAQIYALLHGFEHAIDEELEMIGYVSKADLKHVMDVLTPYFDDPGKLAAFKGFYDIERQLKAAGVERSQAIKILRYLNANDQFTNVIAKMDSSDSPTECRMFKLGDCDT